MDAKSPADNLKLFTQCLYGTAALTVPVALLGWLLGGGRFGLGVLVSACWSLLNLSLLRQLVVLLGKAAASPRKGLPVIGLVLAIKFPVLYFAGYLILAGRWFPSAALLLGFSLWIVSFLGLALRQPFVAAAASVLLVWVPSVFASEAAPAVEMPELPNLITLVVRFLQEHPAGQFLHRWETSLFTLLIILVLVLAAWAATRGVRDRALPNRAQGLAEAVVEGFNNFVCGIIGPEGRQYTPFLGTLFLYIWFCNLAGLVPLVKSPTTGFRSVPGFPVPMIPVTTLPLALAVLIYVQVTAIRRRGLLGYLDHLAGEPRNPFTLLVAPIMLVLHLLGELLTKPLSLSFRLFGNISSEDAVVAVLVGMGFAFLWVEFPILWLALILSTVQAVVFTLLSTIYIAMVLPHEHEEHPPTNEKGA